MFANLLFVCLRSSGKRRTITSKISQNCRISHCSAISERTSDSPTKCWLTKVFHLNVTLTRTIGHIRRNCTVIVQSTTEIITAFPSLRIMYPSSSYIYSDITLLCHLQPSSGNYHIVTNSNNHVTTNLPK